MKSAHWVQALLAGASAFGLASAASAQTTPANNEIVVTGSRVIQNGNNSPTPMTVVSTDQVMSLQPTIIADALNDLPIFSGSRNQESNPGGATNAANELNLRNMGMARTLPLFDGHRLAPTSEDGLVDVNMIPQMLIQRVDVVTGGASAVYGSDAVTGVVNFVTDTHFNGFKLKAQAGVSQYGDDQNQDAGIALGHSFLDGRLHLEASYEYYNDAGVIWRTNRPWGQDVWTVQGAGTAASPYVLVQNTRNANSSFGGLITSGALASQDFAQPGVLSPFVHGSQIYPGGYESGGEGAYSDSSVKAPLRTNQVFGRADYDVTDHIHAYVEGTTTWNFNAQYNGWEAINNLSLSAQNPYLPAQYQSQLAAAAQSSFKFSKTLMDGPRSTTNVNEEQSFIVAGLDGDLGAGYKWDLAYSHSDNEVHIANPTTLNNGHLYAAMNAVVNPATGQIVCNASLTNAAYSNCVPLNLFGPNTESQAALNYILTTSNQWYRYLMDDVTGSVSGAPFSTWAGPVKTAANFEWRNLGYSLVSDKLPTDTINCAGITLNCSATSVAWSVTAADRTPVSESVGEGGAEIDVPLLKDMPFAQALNLNAAARYTDYSVSGSAVTWKFGLDWRLDPQVTLRATSSRDIRAPNLNDLYAPSAITQTQITDLLTGQTPLALQYNGGNPNLKPEVSTTWTAGIVYRPDWLPRFSVSVDAYDILVRNAITSIQGTNPQIQTACYQSGGASPYCQLQIRPAGYANTSASNAVTEWINTTINIAIQHTYGADVEVNYSGSLFGRPWTFRDLLEYQPHIEYIQAGLATFDMAGAAYNSNSLQASPVWRTTAFFHYLPTDNLALDVMERWRSPLNMFPTNSGLVFDTPTMASVAYTNMTVTYTLKRDFGPTDLFFNVANLFNTQPPPGAFFGANGAVGSFGGFAFGDDPIGREFTVGLRFRH